MSHRQFVQSKNRRYNCILINFLLALSNVSFLSSFWFWVALYSCDFAIVRFLVRRRNFLLTSSCDFLTEYSDVLLLKSSFNLFLRMFLIFWTESETIEIIVFEWLLVDLDIEYGECFSHENFDKFRRLFQLLWRSWFVIIAVNNRKLETIGACR